MSFNPKGVLVHLSPKGLIYITPKGLVFLIQKGLVFLIQKGVSLLDPKGVRLLNPKVVSMVCNQTPGNPLTTYHNGTTLTLLGKLLGWSILFHLYTLVMNMSEPKASS